MKIVSMTKLGALAVIMKELLHDSSPEVHFTSNDKSSWSGTLSVTLNLNFPSIVATASTSNDVIVALTNMGYDKKNCETVIEKIAKDIDSSLSQSAKEELLFRKAIVELSL